MGKRETLKKSGKEGVGRETKRWPIRNKMESPVTRCKFSNFLQSFRKGGSFPHVVGEGLFLMS